MAVYRYPPEIEDFVREHSMKLRDDDLAELVNETFGTHFTASSMKAYRGNHHIRNGRKQWTSEEYWRYQKRYPQGMIEFIRENSWGVPSKEMAEMVNERFGTSFTQTGMKQFRQRHGIKSGLTGWYQKGHPPGNKGKKIEEFCSPEAIEKIRRTTFKKGHHPANEKPVGTVLKTSDGYLIRKISMTGTQWQRWEFLHKTEWIRHNGPIPEGMLVSFKDGNKEHTNIENLMLISKRENQALMKKGLRCADPDITMAGLAFVRLEHAIKDREENKS